MAKNNTIPIRLSHEKWLEYSALAEASRMGLSTYLRQRLEEGDKQATELQIIKSIVEELRNKSKENAQTVVNEPVANNAESLPVQVETLYLLRALAGPEKVRFVQGEIERIGLTVWKK